MGLRELLRRGGPTVRVQLLLRGRIGTEWLDVDQALDVPVGTTLRQFIALADRRGLGLSAALAASPHLRDTLMWNGERAPVAEHQDRVLADGDQLYLLAPLAGG